MQGIQLLLSPIQILLLYPWVTLGCRILGDKNSDSDIVRLKEVIKNGNLAKALQTVKGSLAKGVLAWTIASPIITGTLFVILWPLFYNYMHKKKGGFYTQISPSPQSPSLSSLSSERGRSNSTQKAVQMKTVDTLIERTKALSHPKTF